MELWKPWGEVVKLGQRIIHELKLGREYDVLSRWMAHRIAELMDRAERSQTAEEREAAERECTDLIMKLWTHRASRTHSRPLAEIASFLEQLVSSVQVQHFQGPSNKKDNTWLGILPHLTHIQEREEEVCKAAALAGLPLKRDKEWLQEHPNDLSDEEKHTIERLLYLQEYLGEEYFGQKDPTVLGPEQITKRALEILSELETERLALFSSIRESVGYAIVRHAVMRVRSPQSRRIRPSKSLGLQFRD
jgi:DNA primase